jgi:hypothetical protein
MNTHQTTVLARMIWRLSCGRNGEEVVSAARDYPVFDPRAGAETAVKAVFGVAVVVLLFAVAGTAIDPDLTLSADLQDARRMLDL